MRRTAELAHAADRLAKANEELTSSSLRLEQSNRELRDFASVASHDLQEPLRKVQVFGDRLRTLCSEVLEVQGRDYLNRMLNATGRMQTLIQDLLKIARITSQAHPFSRVDLAQVAREVLSDLEVRISETNARVEVGHLPTIQADGLQIRQLLQNLIGNALKFHQKGIPPVIKVYAEKAGIHEGANGMFLLVVEDNGIGFDEKYLDRIFTVFQRLHGRAEYEGTGVGLAICRKIVQRHGGDITARSTPGHGASFLVALPLVWADESPPIRTPAVIG
jgi:light-regulated signal transduction histidine kinase (bacteriophytochrome)